MDRSSLALDLSILHVQLLAGNSPEEGYSLTEHNGGSKGAAVSQLNSRGCSVSYVRYWQVLLKGHLNETPTWLPQNLLQCLKA